MIQSPPIWLPNAGPQMDAYLSSASETWYGGAAGGGKTSLAIGLCITAHRESIIFRRVYDQLKSIIDELQRITGERLNQNKKRLYTRDGRMIELGSMPQESDKDKFQGRPHDLIVYDEVTHFSRTQFSLTKAWCRTRRKNQRTRVVCTFNPPQNSEQEWVLDYLAPWLKQDYPQPAEPGEIRHYYSNEEGHVVWTDSPNPVKVGKDTIYPMSCTFVKARVEDNPYYMDTGYDRILDSLEEPLRSQLRHGDFAIGRGEDAWQVIPTRAIKSCVYDVAPAGGVLVSVGIDVARGGTDKTCFAYLFSDKHIEVDTFLGVETPDAAAVAQRLRRDVTNTTPILIDSIGVGASVFDFLKSKYKKVSAVNVGSSARGMDKSKRYEFYNLRAELWWKFRESLEANEYLIPNSRSLHSDLSAPQWSLTAGAKIQVESKDKIKKRLGRSPDEADAVLLACAHNRYKASNLIYFD